MKSIYCCIDNVAVRHGVFVGEWLFVFPLCGLFLSLFCNYNVAVAAKEGKEESTLQGWWQQFRERRHDADDTWMTCK